MNTIHRALADVVRATDMISECRQSNDHSNRTVVVLNEAMASLLHAQRALNTIIDAPQKQRPNVMVIGYRTDKSAQTS